MQADHHEATTSKVSTAVKHTTIQSDTPYEDASNPRQRSLEFLARLRKLKREEKSGTALSCQSPDLQRLVGLISMAPRSFASAEVLSQRREAISKGQTTTHWPFLFVSDEGFTLSEKSRAPLDRPEQRELI